MSTAWRTLAINAEGPRVEKEHRRIGRETPSVLAGALGCENRQQRWNMLQQYREQNPKHCSLRSWNWLETAIMDSDVVTS